MELLEYLLDAGLAFPVLAPALFGYQEAVRFACGTRLCWDPRQTSGDDVMPAALLDVPGEACETLGWDRLRAVALPLKLTRVDVAFDGHSISPRVARSAWMAGKIRTRLRSPNWHENPEGQGFTLGTRHGSAQVQWYDRRGFNRMELRLYKGRAQVFHEAGAFLGDRRQFVELAASHLRAVVDFVDPTSDKNRSRQSPLPWWLAFLGDVRRAEVQLPKRAPTCEASHRTWIRRIAKSLGRALDRDGEDHLLGVARRGRDSLHLRGPRSSVQRRAERPERRGALPSLPRVHGSDLETGGASLAALAARGNCV